MAIETVELSLLSCVNDSSCGSPALKRDFVEQQVQSPKRQRTDHCEEEICSAECQSWVWDGGIVGKLSFKSFEFDDTQSDHDAESHCESPSGCEVALTELDMPLQRRLCPAREVTWYQGAQLLEHLMKNEQDSKCLTEMLRDTFRHVIGRLAVHNPAYHPRMGYIDLVDPRCQYGVVRLDGKVVGIGTMHPRYAGLAGFTLITHLMVHHDARGQGLGSFLLDALHNRIGSATGEMIGMLVPSTLPAEQMMLTLPRCLGWLCENGYYIQDWNTTSNPFTACTLLQLNLEGVPFRDYHFLFRASAGGPDSVAWQHSINDGSLLQQLRVLKLRVLGRCRDGMRKLRGDGPVDPASG